MGARGRGGAVVTPLALFLATLAVLAVVFVAGVLMVWTRQERIAYQPPRGPWPAAENAVRVDYTASDSQPLFGLLVGDRDTASRLLLVFHGNADLAVWQIDWARELVARTGYLVLLAEYRGYNGLPGSPTYAGLQHDARAAYAFATDSLRIAPSAIAIFGHSIGTAVAAELAMELNDRTRPSVLILQSPFTSARSMARFLVWRPVLALWKGLSRIHYDTRERVRLMDTPLWVAHGNRDFLIPVRMGYEVHAAAKRKGEFLLVRGAGHNDVASVGGEEYWGWMARALGESRQ